MRKSTVALMLATGALFIGAGTASAASLVSAKKLEINVDETKTEAERKALWEKVGGWCAIKDWHPAVAACEERKEGDDTFRTLTLKDGGKIDEKLVDTGATSYRYIILTSPFPVKNYEAQFSVTPDDDDLDEINVVWSATYDAADGKDDKDARATIDGVFKAGIDSIKEKYGTKGDDDDKK
ncbi:SRPBCC family protein [uncultured Hyphomicrobium sp.]|uniref:SRPBCC family protein n=1 Tax=uncultured Hyphomicrobium sp. TaxID=194373 RepID=UPI0025EE9E9B|nr:SRPBCC family protein [uncultured Hyphomicrobium sp.]